jgi:hypothetical protein
VRICPSAVSRSFAALPFDMALWDTARFVRLRGLPYAGFRNRFHRLPVAVMPEPFVFFWRRILRLRASPFREGTPP